MLLGSAAEKPLAEAARHQGRFFLCWTPRDRTTIPPAGTPSWNKRLCWPQNDTGHHAPGKRRRALPGLLSCHCPAPGIPAVRGRQLPSLEPALACHPCSFNQICRFLIMHACGKSSRIWRLPCAWAARQGSWLEGLTDEMRASKARIWLTGAAMPAVFRISGAYPAIKGRGQSAWLAWQFIFGAKYLTT